MLSVRDLTKFGKRGESDWRIMMRGGMMGYQTSG
jgi:hypothetical protein